MFEGLSIVVVLSFHLRPTIRIEMQARFFCFCSFEIERTCKVCFNYVFDNIEINLSVQNKLNFVVANVNTV